MTKEQKQEFTLRISHANKTQLIVILYEMLLVYISDAQKANAEDNREKFLEGIRKARKCVNELINSLNFEKELAKILLQLYLYINREMTGAVIYNQTDSLEHVILVIEGLHEAYLAIATSDTSSAVMD